MMIRFYKIYKKARRVPFRLLDFIKYIFRKRKSVSQSLQEIEKYMVEGKPVKLHSGCGTNYKKGWINLDNNSEHNILKLDLEWDLRWPLPISDNSVDFIYHEHFLEHLTIEEGLKSLSDFRRVLKPGGIMRVAMPDLEWSMKEYFNPKWRENPGLEKWGLAFVQTRAELINISFRAWGHKHLYDSEELERRLREAGFSKIVFCKHGESQHVCLSQLETREESILIAEAEK